MRGMNRVFILGRLGKDPELRTGKTGTAWCSFGVATNRARKEGDTWIEETDWHDVRVFGSDAERCHRLGRKGTLVAIEGSIVYETWTDEAGTKQKRARVMANRIQLVSDLKARDEEPPALAPLPPAAEPTTDAEIPF